jgi:hypothetical protein
MSMIAKKQKATNEKQQTKLKQYTCPRREDEEGGT